MKKILFLLLTISLFACETAPLEITEDMPVTLYFKKAQDAEKNNDINRAIAYYEALIENNSGDIINVTKAEFEIARLHYKQGKLNQAKEELLALKTKYNQYPAGYLPAAELILTNKLLEQIESKTTKKDQDQ